MSEPTEGISGKYIIRKSSGQPLDPEACYFVLRLDGDEAARFAAIEYAIHCDDRKLASDLTKCVAELRAPCSCRSVGDRCARHPMFSAVWTAGASRDRTDPGPQSSTKAAGQDEPLTSAQKAAHWKRWCDELHWKSIQGVAQAEPDALREANRYRWLREQVKTDEKRVLAQALFWNNGSRGEFDKAVDTALPQQKE